ncbi:M14 family metallopeptidase [Ilumatobacter coccineus]|uniref:Peptidase M14 family protein n=1 Tax=Ilumatobacter coccineus (strain NBRC 103263 / KCTC 29153 / YM16-304) TaxID=1313172 RepID=A0A6C7EIC6_ILUCY|nr:M14 family metallopeptidase [Ilumatobacter coccineus]BAN03726.1 peptidase M14 family protein [Ilumatobacter coccineus YM16-304]
MDYGFDRYLRYDELVEWLRGVEAARPGLVSIESYGTSHEGRDLLIATVTDTSSGSHDTKPAHWVDASIHATELTATVAACALIDHLVSGHGRDEQVTLALATRTFYIVPRVNPDGAEWALADSPKFRRSSTRAWPWTDGHRWPGLHREDVDGDGRLLQMRLADPNGAWMPHPDDERLMIPVPPDGRVTDGAPRYRLLAEGTISESDGFTIPTPSPVEGLDLNRNFPAGWGTSVPGSGDHPLSEPEIDALVRAIVARPNICGSNAFHTSGGVLLRPSSTRPDSKVAPMDVWVWNQLAERGTALTGYPAHSVYEDFTWDPSETMSGAADDWTYEHLGVYGWTTEFWDIVHAATGTKQSTHFWYTGPTVDEAIAVLRWCDDNHPEGHVDWYDFDHPQLGPVQLGGWNTLSTWTNPPLHLLHDEVATHADFAVYQALSSPRLEIVHHAVESLGDDMWRVEIGIANTGWLPTDVSALARKEKLVAPITARVGGDGVTVIGSAGRVQLGQLDGRAALRFRNGNDGTPDRVLATWTVRAASGSRLDVVVDHPRCGSVTTDLTLA